MPIATAQDFLQVLKKCNLLSSDVIGQVSRELSSGTSPASGRDLAAWLVERGHLTPWQSERLLAGQTRFFLGRYQLLERIGRGGMGVVFKARHAVMGRTVALKVLDGQLVRSAEARARFLREVKSLAALSHPNIVAAFDADCVDNTQFLVMEYVAGHDLRYYIRHVRPLEISWCCDVARQVALGLEHAHQRGFVHRDIKPGNLLVSVDPADGSHSIKILDLGLAKLASVCLDDSSLTQAGQVVGTPDYIAPEQVDSAGQIDIRADIFSLGCTLFEMLSGRRPYEGENLTAKVMARLAHEAPPVRTHRAEVSPHLEQIVARMMSRDPARRFQTPAEVAAALLPHAREASGDSSSAVPILPAVSAAGDSTMPPSDLQDFFERLGTHAVDDTPGRGSRTVGRSEVSGRWRPNRGPAWRQPQVLLAAGMGLLLLIALGVAWRINASDEPERTAGSAGTAGGGLDLPANEDPRSTKLPATGSPNDDADDLDELLPQFPSPEAVASTAAEAAVGEIDAAAMEEVPTPATVDTPAEAPPSAAAPAVVAQAPRLDVPEADALAEARRRVNRDFREEISASESPNQKAALAKKLLDASRGETEGPAHAYAMLDRASEMAAQSADPTVLEAVVAELDERFAVDGWELRATGFKEAARQARAVDQQRELARAALGLIEGAAQADHFDAADALANVARGLAVKAKDADLSERVSASRGNLKWRRDLWESASAALELLQVNSDDGATHLSLGRHLCFGQRKWTEGLPHLARGSDGELATIASLEEAAAADPARYPEAAAAWWQHQEHDRSDWRPLVQQRAVNLYLESLPVLPSPAQADVRAELDRMFQEAPILRPQPAAKGLIVWFKADAGVRHDDQNRVFQWDDQSGNENHATQTDPNIAMSFVPGVLNGMPVLRTKEKSAEGLVVPARPIVSPDGMSVVYLAIPRDKTGGETVVNIHSESAKWQLGFWGESLGWLDTMGTAVGAVRDIEADTPCLVGYLLTRGHSCVTYLNAEIVGQTPYAAVHSGSMGLQIGAGSVGSPAEYPFGGDIAEILIYDRPLRPEEYRRVFIYLTHKYGLALRPPAEGRLDE